MISFDKTFQCPHVCENKNELGFCRTTWCINPLHCKGTYVMPQPSYKLTNGAKVRAMTDEELATWLGDMLGVYPFGTEQWDRQAWLDWLKKEVEE